MSVPDRTPVPICFVASHAQLGGAEGVLGSLLATFDPGWIDRVLVLAEGPFVERLRAQGLEVEVVPSGRRSGLITGAMRMRRLLKRHRPALIHANGVKAALVSVIAAARTGIPVLWHKHDTARDGRIGRWIARRCELVVGVSASSVASLQRVRGVEAVVVENGIPPYEADREAGRAKVLEAAGASSRSAAEPELIGMIGRLHPAKGHLALVEICAELAQRFPGLHLVIAGAPDPYEPGYEERLRARVDEAGIGDRVAFLGFRDDAVEIAAGCDLIAMPSTPDPESGWREGFPLAPLEAMAVGTPVVGYAEPGIVEVLGACGELVPTGDRDRLRDAIAGLVGSPDRRRELSACGRERVKRFGLPEAAARMLDAYRTALAGS